MKVVNILLNYKKANHNNHVLGVERCFIDYAKYLTQMGVKVVSVLKSKIFLVDEVKKTNCQICELPAISQIDIYSIIKLAYLFLRFNPDIIICHSGRALTFARIARILIFKKIPIAVIDHGINPIKFLKADYVLTVNSFFSKELIKAGMPENRSIVIPNMIEIPKNFQELIKQPFGKNSDENSNKKIRLGSLGRLSPEKNFDKVIHAMKILKDQGIEVEYLIGGIGNQQQELEDLAEKLQLKDQFKILGWVEDKREFFSNIDIFILPSFGETFGIVLLEAMLYSTAIITSNSWGPDEIIQDGINGLKISKDDVSQIPSLIAQAILRLNDDQELVKSITSKARTQLFEKYSSEVVSQKLYKICEKIIDQK